MWFEIHNQGNLQKQGTQRIKCKVRKSLKNLTIFLLIFSVLTPILYRTSGVLTSKLDTFFLVHYPKLYTPSTLNIDFKQWHTQLNVCAVKWITHDLIHDFHFTFQAYALPHTLNGIFVSLYKFHTWISKQLLLCPKRPALQKPIKV